MMTEFLGNLSCPLDFGHTLVIVGKTTDGASRFHINLRTGKPNDEHSNIGLRLSCYFRDDAIARNALIDGQWGQEEMELNLDENTAPNPIVPGEFFIICIFASSSRFHIAVNNRPFCTFDYRMPLQTIRTVEILDHIQDIKQIDHRTIFPYAWPPVHASDFGKAFSNDIPILYTPGHVIVITGLCTENRRGQFIIKFMEGDSKREELHFNPRFEQKIVVRNSMKKNFEFGPEERDGGFPFVFDQQFQLAIAFTEKEFRFAVDGKYFSSYAYRTPNILESLVGLKVTCLNGLKLTISNLDHVQMGDPTCAGFENYSNSDVEIV